MQQPSAAMQQPVAAMHKPAAKQHPLASMQQLATTQQPLSLDESPIFQRNSSAESPNLEDTANNDNCHIDFYEYSSMPSSIDLATAGLLQYEELSPGVHSDAIATKKTQKHFIIVLHDKT